MKKLLIAALLATMAFASVASIAAPVDTPAGSLELTREDGAIVLEGLPGNPDPLDGYAGVDPANQTVYCSDEGDFDDDADGDGDNDPEVCNPAP